ncbi:hypothetical protein D1007_54857 [Hordeum vulgare]|nr:hypothetical protein D1007_54857 [Hordeum vulgare]
MVGERKKKLADYDPYEGAFSDDSEYEGKVASFTAKEVQKIKAKRVASFGCKFKKWHCPYCTTKPNPKDGRFDHLLSHAEDAAICGEDYKIRGQHAALAKALTPA